MWRALRARAETPVIDVSKGGARGNLMLWDPWHTSHGERRVNVARNAKNAQPPVDANSQR